MGSSHSTENNKLLKNVAKDDDLKNTMIVETTIVDILKQDKKISIFCYPYIENNYTFSGESGITLLHSHPNFNELSEKLIKGHTYKFTFKYTYKTRQNTLISIDDAKKYNIVGMVKSFVEISGYKYVDYYKIIISCNYDGKIIIRRNIIVHKNNMTNIMVNDTYEFTYESIYDIGYYQVVEYKKLNS